MKIKLSFLFIFLFMFSINFVNADTGNMIYRLQNENFTSEENLGFFTEFSDNLSKLYDDVYIEYLNKYSDIYPYYAITYYGLGECIKCNEPTSYIRIYFSMYSTIPTSHENAGSIYMTNPDLILSYSYFPYNSTYKLPIEPVEYSYYVHPLSIRYFYSNFDLILNLENYDSINIETFPSSNYNLTLNNGDVIPTAHDFFNFNILNDPNKVDSSYIEVDLNQYSYIALSLKDYNTIPESTYSTYVNFYVKGKLCATPVYNYGQTERKEIMPGTQVQSCTEYYNNYTNVRFYLLPSDVKNHAIYYLKSNDISKDNIIKIDTSVFNISYITEENKNNPQVQINNKLYPTLPYDNLTDTATKSEDEGYVSGTTCAVGDLNCYTENNAENLFDSLFDKPLEMMKTVWGAIVTIFALISEFILLLPPTMQGFLYVAFGISIVLGIIKILL